jgi:hypothetical protein
MLEIWRTSTEIYQRKKGTGTGLDQEKAMVKSKLQKFDG